MGLLILPKKFDSDFANPRVKPVGDVEIDWSNPLSKDIYEVFLFKHGYSGVIRLREESGNNPPKSGGDVLMDGTSDEYLDYGTNHSEIDNLTNFSVTASVDIATVSRDLMIAQRAATNFEGFNLFFDVTGGTGGPANFQIFIRDPGGGQERAGSGANKTVGKYIITGTFNGDGTPGAKCQMYVDGINESAASGENTDTASGVGESLFIGRHSGGSRDFEGTIQIVIIHKRTLLDAEVARLHSNLFQVIKPIELPKYFISIGGAISIIVNSLSQTQTIDQPNLTQAHSLVSNDLDQAQTIDQPTLTQANILGVNDLDQAQTIDIPSLTQAHILSVDDLTQNQTIDNVTLAVAGALLVDDLTQSQTIDLANIIQAHILSVNDLAQAQSIDQPSLAIGITVDDLTQAQTIDVSALVQAHILSVDNLTQAQLLSNVASGAIVVGFHKGEVLVFSAYNGIITATNAHTGKVTTFNAVDIT